MDARIETVRRFSRLYTKRIGLLHEGFLDSPFTLTEGRLIYELAQRGQATASTIGAALGLDAGYLSRVLRSLVRRGIVRKRKSPEDRRHYLLSLSERGTQAFAQLNATSQAEVGSMLAGLAEDDQQRLVTALSQLEAVLGDRQEPRVPYVLRPHHVGDMGWVVEQQARLYNREFGWTSEYEALCAEIVAQFLRHFEPNGERCWIAEREGERVGSVFLMRHRERDRVARLRLLFVDERARGLGIGQRLVRECTHFAREAGYQAITLWTNSILHAARRIYQHEGYRLVHEEAHHTFGHDLVGQTWELAL